MTRSDLLERYRAFLYRTGKTLQRNMSTEPIVQVCNELDLDVVYDKRNSQYLIGKMDRYIGTIPFESDQVAERVAELWVTSAFT